MSSTLLEKSKLKGAGLRETGTNALKYVNDNKMMEWIAFSFAMGLILITIFLVYGTLGPSEPKWLSLLIIPIMLYAIMFFGKLMVQMEKTGNDGEKLNMFWKFWRLLKAVVFSPLLLVFLYAISLSLLGTQLSYLDKNIIWDNGGGLWTAVTVAHFITAFFYTYVLSSWGNLQDLIDNKEKTASWGKKRKINLTGLMTTLLIIVSGLSTFFYIEIVTKPVINER
ncbi:MAG: hypothetical protein CXT73_05200 [Methanobacteriota archaeon]|nr:MAG: hypothetical protein CXT73_05200 [Euryarchaeota archaeon]